MNDGTVRQSKVRNKLKFMPPGEDVFRYWTSLGHAGNLKIVALHFFEEGYKNPRTGKPPSDMGCWQTMWRWALRNPQLARPIYEEYVLNLDGEIVTDEEWQSLMHSRAKTLLSLPGYRKYLIKHPELQKYADK